MAGRRLVLVVDDDAGARALLRDVLDRAGFEVVEAGSADDAFAAVETAQPHLVLLDVVLPGMSGYELFELLRERLHDLPVIFVSGERTDTYDRVAGLLLGADDYVVKPFDPDELVARVRRSIRPRHAASDELENGGAEAGIASLTPREREVLVLLARGAGTREIAHELVISARTVGTHVQHILGKLGVRNRGQAVALAYRSGLDRSDAPNGA